MEATRLPGQAPFPNELCALVLVNTKRVIDFLAERAANTPYDLLECIEEDFLYQYRRAGEILLNDKLRAGCEAAATAVIKFIRTFRDTINQNVEFVRYKTLVGFRGVFPPDWEDKEFYLKHGEYRSERAAEFVGSITENDGDQWLSFAELCAATKSNDLATFPTFGKFLELLATAQPSVALMFVERGSENLLVFLPALLNGMHASEDQERYRILLEIGLAQDKHLTAVAQHFRYLEQVSPDDVKSLLNKAVAAGNDSAVIECLVCAVEKHEASNAILLEEVFMSAIEFLTTREDVRWIQGVWFLRQGKEFFQNFSLDQASLVTNNLLFLKRIGHEAETILTHIASSHPSVVWNFFAKRFEKEADDPLAYDAAPYQFHGLEQELRKDPSAALEAVWRMSNPNDPSFRFEGAQLLRAIFPDFPEAFANELLNLLSTNFEDRFCALHSSELRGGFGYTSSAATYNRAPLRRIHSSHGH